MSFDNFSYINDLTNEKDQSGSPEEENIEVRRENNLNLDSILMALLKQICTITKYYAVLCLEFAAQGD